MEKGILVDEEYYQMNTHDLVVKLFKEVRALRADLAASKRKSAWESLTPEERARATYIKDAMDRRNEEES